MWFDTKPIKRPAHIAAELLKDAELSMEDRQMLTAVLLDRLGALPLRARIQVVDGRVLVDGKSVDAERAQRLHDSSKAMLDNFARRFVRETVEFLAVKKGVHEYVNPEQGLFARAALWHFQEEDILYRKLAGLEDDEDVQ